MNETVEAEFYSVGDRDIIYTTTVEDAIQQWGEEWWKNSDVGLNELPHLEINAYNRTTIGSNNELSQWLLEHIMENLDENYGCDETWGDFEISDEARVYWDKFVECIYKEYPVSGLTNIGSFMVDPRDYLHE